MPDSQENPKRHSVACQRHGVRYNPELTEGCVLCRREQNTESSSRAPGIGWKLGLVLGLVALSVWSLQWGRGTVTATDPETDVADRGLLQELAANSSGRVGASAKLAADPFRSEIEAIESILYQGKPSEIQTADRASGALVKLGHRVSEGQPRLLAIEVSREVIFLAARIGGEADAGYSVLDLHSARSRWEQLRDERFVRTNWFRSSSESIDRVQTPEPPKRDPRIIAAMENVASDLDGLVAQGRSQAMAFGEPYVDAPERSRALGRLVDRWSAWSRGWSEDVRRVGIRLPAQPPLDADSRVLQAYNDLGAALASLYSVPVSANDSGIPFKQQRRNRLETAQHHVDAARISLSALNP